ncbi:MAG: hypothetical protein COX62_01135 [Deltaproteobacteria bacterium CG_4_10_14_0_2_um_filter_43_8]|nr:MAG: hypothetical protein COX62_01135 [Deltaproteobacteria bacterium CG_4_10_14_0_2_um_filter_43_8]
MKKILILLFCFFSLHTSLHAEPAQNEMLKKKLIKEMKQLDAAIVDVRPARVYEASQPKFVTRWTPALTLKPGTSLERQTQIAKKAVAYVTRFQDGVLTDKVEGGIIVFFEGKNWEPEIGNIGYLVPDSKANSLPVKIYLRTKDEQGRSSCCTMGEQIGVIENNRFKAK